MYRLNKLLKLDRKIYHTNDLGILWDITNKNTLYTTIKRYVQKGILIPIYKGLYTTVPLSNLHPFDLGRAIIHRYAYVSTESVLSEHGVISQATYAHTFVSDIAKKITVGTVSFLFRKVKSEFLNNPIGITNQDGRFIASLERATADMLYFDPTYHIDLRDRIDWKKVKQIQKEVGYLC